MWVFCTAVEKARAEAMSLTDMYVQVKYDEQLFSVFDDTENILVQSVIDGLDEWRDSSGERSDAAIIAFLRKVLNHEDVNHALHSLDIIPPFSVVLVDNEMEPVADLITLDDENIYLHDDFGKKWIKSLTIFWTIDVRYEIRWGIGVQRRLLLQSGKSFHDIGRKKKINNNLIIER